jgi:hypothetical protein
MTIIVAVPSVDGLVVASDSRWLLDGEVRMAARKLLVGPNWVIAAHGSVLHQGQHLLDYVNQLLSNSPASASSIVQTLSTRMPKVANPAGLVVAGWDADRLRVVSIPSSGSSQAIRSLPAWFGETWPLEQFANGSDQGGPQHPVKTVLNFNDAIPLPQAVRLARHMVRLVEWSTEFVVSRSDRRVVPAPTPGVNPVEGIRRVMPTVGGDVQVAVLSAGEARWWA